jgi:putative transposase
MGWEAIPPQPRRRQPAANQVISPDLGRGLTVHRGNQVWRAEMTDVRLAGGLVDLGAVSAWCSRYVRAWAVSSPTAVALCVEAVEQAIRPGQPEIGKTEPGAQFTRLALSARRKTGGMRSRMDGRGRALDHVVVERWWRSVNDEAVDRRDDPSVWDACRSWARYVGVDNRERLHQALGDWTPAAGYLASGVGRLSHGHLATESTSHSEVLTPNVCGPKHGLDDGVHLTIPL